LLDDVRARLDRVFRVPNGSFAFAVSGTGASGMETVVANLVEPGKRVVSIVNGYFWDRIAQMCGRYGATVRRGNGDWGRACAREALEAALKQDGCDIVTMVHAETSTGVLNPVDRLAPMARRHGALTVVDAVTSFGGHPLDIAAWEIDACYSCTQKCLGA